MSNSPSLPPVGTLRFASLSSSHTNMVLKSFATGQPHPDQRFTMAGKLSPEKIHAVDEQFYDAIMQGIVTVLRYCQFYFWNRVYCINQSLFTDRSENPISKKFAVCMQHRHGVDMPPPCSSRRVSRIGWANPKCSKRFTTGGSE